MGLNSTCSVLLVPADREGNSLFNQFPQFLSARPELKVVLVNNHNHTPPIIHFKRHLYEFVLCQFVWSMPNKAIGFAWNIYKLLQANNLTLIFTINFFEIWICDANNLTQIFTQIKHNYPPAFDVLLNWNSRALTISMLTYNSWITANPCDDPRVPFMLFGAKWKKKALNTLNRWADVWPMALRCEFVE